ncbi:MAG: S-methyl-5-thioribose-1-phosphate isomerase [Desulfobacterales bacterium]|jgi:methylthioribose-1-phosphate isomerase
MNVDGKNLRTIWLSSDEKSVKIIDQRRLPHELVLVDLHTVDDAITAIRDMAVRGAPLIGATGAYGVYLAALNAPEYTIEDDYWITECNRLKSARPTAVNLAWAVERALQEVLKEKQAGNRVAAARDQAASITEEEVDRCKKMGIHGLTLIDAISRRKQGRTVNVLTHCNAGWLACIEHGTATAPIYEAYNRGIDLHVWVDETRPLNQGSRLTAWELGKQGVRHTIITDNAGGYLMQQGHVDIVIVGTDRTTGTGDVANKIGTYLKALAAKDNNIPFYVALPSSTFDWALVNGIKEIPIEERNPDEIRYVEGRVNNKNERVLICPADSAAANYAFDVTPSRLVTGFITERGICKATPEGIRQLFPERF